MNITFQSMYPFAEQLIQIKPAVQSIPDWYKKIPLKMAGTINELHEEEYIATNSTVKGCLPFLDALTTGYMVTTSADIELTKEDDVIKFRWRVKHKVVGTHNQDQFPNYPAKEVTNDFFKWISAINITTPKGYSTLFTHPLNRQDLPFRTFSGVVETDTYPLPVEFPFQILESTTQLVIPAGTPIAQVFPFKRENWKSKYQEYDEVKTKKAEFALLHKIIKSYKNQWWVKKTYE